MDCKYIKADTVLPYSSALIIAIDMYQISQAQIFFKKPDISPISGFFHQFLALFDTFTTRYDHSHIKFEFSVYLYLYKHFIKKSFFKMN